MATQMTLTQQQAISIVPADLADMPNVRAIAAKTFDEAFSPLNPKAAMETYLATAFSEAQMSKELAEAQNYFFLVRRHNEIVGYVKLTTDINREDPSLPEAILSQDSIMLERFYLDSSCHGQGVAHTLMAFCIDFAKSMHKNAIWLGVWEHNPRALAFYRKWDFEIVGSHPFVMGEEIQTDYWMLRHISL